MFEYDYDKLFVTQDRHYGVVGHSHNKTRCYICPHYLSRCAHVSFIEDNRYNLNYPDISEFYHRIDSPRKQLPPRCVSKQKIPYTCSADYSTKLRARPTEAFHCDVGGDYCVGDDVAAEVVRDVLHEVCGECDTPMMIKSSKVVPAIFRDTMCRVKSKLSINYGRLSPSASGE